MTNEPSLWSLARELMEAAQWNRDEAKERLIARMRGDETLLAEALGVAAEQLLATVGSNQRRNLFVAAAPSGRDNTAALQRMASQSVLETYFVGQKPLGDCSPDELREAIHARKSAAKTHERNAAFLTAVLKKLKPVTKRVRDDLNADEVTRILRRFPC